MIDIVYGIPLLSLLSSVCFYKGLKYFQNTYNLKVSQCSVALCHDIYISFMAVLYLNNYISDYTWSMGNGISLGYAMYDFIPQYLIGKKYSVMIHHFVMFCTYLNPTLVHFNLIRKPNFLLNNIVARTSLCEIPSICLSTSFILYKLKKSDTLLFKMVSILLLLTYIPFRLINFPIITYDLLKVDPYYYTTGCISTFTLLSYYWYYYLVKKVLSLNDKSKSKLNSKSNSKSNSKLNSNLNSKSNSKSKSKLNENSSIDYSDKTIKHL